MKDLEGLIEDIVVSSHAAGSSFARQVEHLLSSLSKIIDQHSKSEKLQAAMESPKFKLRTLAEVEREHILAVLNAVEGHRSQAAAILGIGDRTLFRKLKEYGINP